LCLLSFSGLLIIILFTWVSFLNVGILIFIARSLYRLFYSFLLPKPWRMLQNLGWVDSLFFQKGFLSFRRWLILFILFLDFFLYDQFIKLNFLSKIYHRILYFFLIVNNFVCKWNKRLLNICQWLTCLALCV